MKGSNMMQYTTPAMQIVELHAKTAICSTSNNSVTWTYNNDRFSPDQSIGWDRPDYGDLVNF